MHATPTIKVTPLRPVLGAELHGIDVSEGVSDEDMSFVLDSLHRYSVLLLRNQRISPRNQVEFSKRLGPPLRVSLFTKNAPDGAPELTIVSNIHREGKPIGVMDAGALWHSDGSYLPQPDMYTVLYALEVPHRDGQVLGDTLFASTAAAYDALPEGTKARINTLRAVNSFAHNVELRRKANFKTPPVTGAVKDVAPDVDHPMVRAHPFTGRKCMFVSEGHTRSIVGIAPENGDPLLAELYAHIKKPEFVYRHKWRAGDMLIWDNCATQHLAITDYGEIPRLLHRAGIMGTVPI